MNSTQEPKVAGGWKPKAVWARASHRWAGLSPLEKTGAMAVGVVGVAVAGTAFVAVAAPGLISTTIGGGLIGAGGWLATAGLKAMR